ncbi:MAG: UDP-N-acetylglucosamine--N-acetylmuramyl-(pentapeptide) pyrophosphoryl-undecaprenol N-acetylglucosamine transferase [Candidatus Staskawiczbacteria bacterium]|nr:UDP-N-acetylglucosamine--N-acetylmuramyl-(pentapeptide) pyrophosphoryl-undecaprenol N-acetylglucosamine transferase [Candidatus Staskawiczbacteria bacterium]
MRILLTGSGGGGHLVPLIAVVKELKKLALELNLIDLEYLYVGPKIEADFSRQLILNEAIKIKAIMAFKLRRYFSIHNFIDIIKIPIGLIQSLVILFFYMPNIVFSKGGYGTIPVVIVSWLYRIPVIIHESDLISGKANIFASRFAQKILVSFSQSLKYFPSTKTALVGNPVRLELATGSKEIGRKYFKINSQKPVILVMGGSIGAVMINDVILNSLAELTRKYEIIHLTGENNYQKIIKEIEVEIPEDLKEFYHPYPSLGAEIKDAYALADLIISRSGASAIFEIALVGKPSILIPIGNSANNHQRENAYEFEKFEGTKVLEEDNLTAHILISSINNILDNPLIYTKMSQAAKSFSSPDSARIIAIEILKSAGIIV